ncbi:MAG: acyl carrier protein [Bacteriovorax sp.]|nr:acyl carrier protein [Bacteriovorax sp.]
MVKEKVQLIFQDVFDDKNLLVTEGMSAADIEDWDSLGNIDLIVAMENEFKVKFNIKDIQELQNVGDMIRLIEKELAAK